MVDPLHRGDFPTITTAIHAARPGDRILVRPGLYRESVVLDKPLEIIGQGSVEEIAVWIYEGGGGVIEDNDLSGNTQGAWNIAKDSGDKVCRARNKES